MQKNHTHYYIVDIVNLEKTINLKKNIHKFNLGAIVDCIFAEISCDCISPCADREQNTRVRKSKSDI